MSTPKDLRYTEEHEWARADGDAVTVGITDHAQQNLGDIVYVELPPVGGAVSVGDVFGTVESVKAVSELYSPIDGEVVAINENLEAQPELINAEPYDKGWLIRIKPSDLSQLDKLMDADAYDALVAAES